MQLNEIIKKPLITEKFMAKTKSGRYAFVVDKRANKNIVKKAVEDFFKVKVKKVWLMKVLGKRKKVGRSQKKIIKKSDWKKAIVQLNKDQKIDLFETGGAK